jgi:hypothetical protein
MSVNRAAISSVISPPFPSDITDHLLEEYVHIKQQFFLRKYQPSELNGGRFAECLVRLLEFLTTGTYTPFGTSFGTGVTDRVLNGALSNTALPETMRFYMSKLGRVLLDIRNKRDVAHVGGKVSPNYSDSLLVCQAADWILTDLIREYATCPIDVAQRLVRNINEVKIPIVAEVDGFVRVQKTELSMRDRTLVVLYYKQPAKVRDTDIAKWILYKNTSRYRTEILVQLHNEALIHYADGCATLLHKGERYVELHVGMELLV